MKKLNKKLVLASKSPRRRQLLTEAGFEFEVRSIDADESYPADLPSAEVAAYIAQKKANAAQGLIASNELLITADTIVIFEGQIFEKPKDYGDAVRMLSAMSGKAHEVITGVCLWTPDKSVVFSELAKVYFDELSSEEIDYYINTCQPFDKAGSYGIQEWIGHCKITKIEGTYPNIMGLPVHRLYNELMAF